MGAAHDRAGQLSHEDHMAKKKPHPIQTSMEEVRQRITSSIAARIENDSNQALDTLAELCWRGDLNAVRLQAAKVTLELAGAFASGSKTSVTTTTGEDERKVTVRVTYDEKPVDQGEDV